MVRGNFSRDGFAHDSTTDVSTSGDITLTEAAQIHRRHCYITNLSTETIKYYNQIVNKLIGIMGNKKVGDIDTNDLLLFQQALLKENLEPTSINTYLRGAKVFFSFLHKRNIILEDISKQIKYIKQPKEFPYILNDHQLEVLLRAARYPQSTFEQIRNYTIILVFLDTGIRLSELISLRIKNIDLTERSMYILGKDKEERIVYFTRKTQSVLERYLKVRGKLSDNDTVFVSQRGEPLTRRYVLEICHRLAQKAGIDKETRVSPHTLRHTFGTNYIRNGGDPFSLQRLLGHSDVSTVMKYVNMVGKHLKEAYDKYVRGY